MGVVVCLPLFGPPGRELEESPVLHGRQLRTLAAELKARLERAADTMDRLTAAGWSARVVEFDAMLSKPGIVTQDDAERQLQALGIAVDEFIIIEEVDDEDDDVLDSLPIGR